MSEVEPVSKPSVVVLEMVEGDAAKREDSDRESEDVANSEVARVEPLSSENVVQVEMSEAVDVPVVEVEAVEGKAVERKSGLLGRFGNGKRDSEAARQPAAAESEPEFADVEPVEMPAVQIESVAVEPAAVEADPEAVESESVELALDQTSPERKPGILARIGIGGRPQAVEAASNEEIVAVEEAEVVEVEDVASIEATEMTEIEVESEAEEVTSEKRPGFLAQLGFGGSQGSEEEIELTSAPLEAAEVPEVGESVMTDVAASDSAAEEEVETAEVNEVETDEPKRRLFAFNRRASAEPKAAESAESEPQVEVEEEVEVVIAPYEPAPGEEMPSSTEIEEDAVEKEDHDLLGMIGMPRFSQRSKNEREVDEMIVELLENYESQVSQIMEPESPSEIRDELEPIPSEFDAEWSSAIQESLRKDDQKLHFDLAQVYVNALKHSNMVKVLSDGPLIRETAVLEANAEFDWRAFGIGSYTGKNEPTSSTLTTGFTGRLDEDTGEVDFGIRKKIKTGAEVSLSNKLTTLESNSEFLDPNPQTSSQLVLRILQPLGRGGGYQYNLATLKIAHLESEMATAEQVNGLESFLLEVNRAYWGVYLARAAYLQKVALVEETEALVNRIEKRGEIDAEATTSALARAKSSLVERKTSLIRSETAVRNAEEQLRALVNDPEQPIGGGGEIIPASQPVVTEPIGSFEETALVALGRRSEIVQGVAQVRSAGLRLDMAKNERKPLLNLFGELRYSGDDGGRDLGGALSDQYDQGAGWLVGMNFEQSLEKNLQEGRYTRRQYEFRREVARVHELVNDVIVDATTTHREVLTSYRAMQGRYQTVLANRAELKQLKDRLDAGEVDGSIGQQLQLILDSLERSQLAEEEFLIAVVAYNAALASVERAKGTFLEIHDFEIERGPSEGVRKRGVTLEEIKVSARD
ncbi:MAG: TolC family protein [Verrucomicrobiota bacterium]